jgi:hypothetical protein
MGVRSSLMSGGGGRASASLRGGWTTAFDDLEGTARRTAVKVSNIWEHELEAIRHELSNLRGGFLSDFASINRASTSTLRSMASGYQSFGSIAREQIRTQSAGVTAQMGFERQRFTESERMARASVQTAATVEREKERLAGLRSLNEQKLIRESARTAAAIERERLRTATVATREYGRQERERLRVTTASARAAAREYEKELGSGFFSKLGSAATAAFKRTFGVTGKGAQAGGSFLGNAASVATGNLITGAITGAVEQVQEGISSGMDFNRLREALMKSRSSRRPNPRSRFRRPRGRQTACSRSTSSVTRLSRCCARPVTRRRAWVLSVKRQSRR